MKKENKRLLLGMMLSLLLHASIFGCDYMKNILAKDFQSDEIFEVLENIEVIQDDTAKSRMDKFNRKLHIEDEFIKIIFATENDLQQPSLKQLGFEDLELDIKQKPKIAPIVHTPEVKPKLLSRKLVPYPAKAGGARGKVTVCILVGIDGKAEYVSTAGSSGNPIIDGVALEHAITWRFSPALDKRGRPVRCLIYIPIMLEP